MPQDLLRAKFIDSDVSQHSNCQLSNIKDMSQPTHYFMKAIVRSSFAQHTTM